MDKVFDDPAELETSAIVAVKFYEVRVIPGIQFYRQYHYLLIWVLLFVSLAFKTVCTHLQHHLKWKVRWVINEKGLGEHAQCFLHSDNIFF